MPPRDTMVYEADCMKQKTTPNVGSGCRQRSMVIWGQGFKLRIWLISSTNYRGLVETIGDHPGPGSG